MAVLSAGLVMCRFRENELQFFLLHPGGPLYAKKNEGVWSIPKGMPEKDEDLLLAAQREFKEETGMEPTPPFHALGTVKLKSGKTIHAWAFMGEWDESSGIKSNYFDFEWPPRSGKKINIPEADRAEWMSFEKAVSLIHPNQIPLLERAREVFKFAGH
jgi:predicted NUDIX family NTP pyrophosphohydrolase